MTSIQAPLNLLAQKVDAKYKPMAKQTLFRLDKEGSDQARAWFNSSGTCYAVDASADVLMSLEVLVTDFKKSDEAVFSLELKLSLVSAKPEFLRECVRQAVSPQNWLETWLKDYVNTQAAHRPERNVTLNQWLYSDEGRLIEGIEKGLHEFGLRAELRATAQSLGLSVISFTTTTFSVRPKDVDFQVAMSLDIRIDPCQGRVSHGPMNEDQWHVQIRHWVIDYVELHLGINDIFLPENQKFNDFLAYLCDKIREYNWQVQRLKVDVRELPFNTTWKTDSLIVDWRGLKGALQFKVKMQVQVNDYQRYIASGKISLEQFSREAFQRAFETDLFEGDFESLNPQSLKAIYLAVGSLVRDEAFAYGLDIVYLVADPLIDEWRLLSDESYQVDVSRYTTAHAAKEIELSINIVGRFANLREVIAAGQKQSSPETAVTNVAREAAQEVIRKRQYHECFAQYTSGRPTEGLSRAPSSGQSKELRGVDSLELEIMTTIKKALYKKIGFVVRSVEDIVVTRSDTDLFDVFKRIEGTPPQRIELTVRPMEAKNELDHLPITIQFRYLTPAADRVANLSLERCECFATLTRDISTFFLDQLQGKSCLDIVGESPADRTRIKAGLNTQMNTVLLNLGLSIEIESIDARRTIRQEAAKQKIDELIQIQVDSIDVDRIKRLRNKEVVTTAFEARQEQIAQFGKKVQEEISLHDTTPAQAQALIDSFSKFCEAPGAADSNARLAENVLLAGSHLTFDDLRLSNISQEVEGSAKDPEVMETEVSKGPINSSSCTQSHTDSRVPYKEEL